MLTNNDEKTNTNKKSQDSTKNNFTNLSGDTNDNTIKERDLTQNYMKRKRGRPKKNYKKKKKIFFKIQKRKIEEDQE